MSLPKVLIHKENERGNILTVQDPFPFMYKGKFGIVPVGFESDGFSTPQFLWATISPAVDPRTLAGAITHDYIYRVQPHGWTRADADAMLYAFVRRDGLNWYRAQKAHIGLTLFGWVAWNKAAKELAANEFKLEL